MREKLIDAAIGATEHYPGAREMMALRLDPVWKEFEADTAVAVGHLRSAVTILNCGGLTGAAVNEIDAALHFLERYYPTP